MQHFFANKKIDNKFYFDSFDEHHLKNVLRIKNGENIIVAYDECFYDCITVINAKEVYAQINKILDYSNELKSKVTLVYGLPKGDKFELVIQKATELGVNEIIPYNAKRSIVQIEPKKVDSKLERWNKIVHDASMQSKRNVQPIIYKPMDLNEVLKLNADLKLIAFEEESYNGQETLFKVLNQDLNNKQIILMVGPEGGFENYEVDKLVEQGFIRVSLGKRILRSETAAIDMLAITAFMLEK